MKKKTFLARVRWGALVMLATGGLLLTSCASDGFDEETYTPTIGDEDLVSPAAEDVEITPTATGAEQVISWPVQLGVGGYQVDLYDVTDPNNVVTIYSGLVDGSSVRVPRAEDTDYRLTILAKGNPKYKKEDAASTTEILYSTFVQAYATIPTGEDLYEYFHNNPVPAEGEKDEYIYDLPAGGEYTMSQSIDQEELSNQRIVIRGKSKTNRAKLTLTGNASFLINTGFVLRTIDIDCSQSTEALIAGSKTPIESSKGASGTGDFYMIGLLTKASPVTIQNCNITGVNGYLYFDNSVKYCIKDFTIDNCQVHFTSSTDNINGGAYFYFKSGYINDLVVQNSTFWNTGASKAKYFTQYANNQRGTRSGLGNTTVTYTNNTFYNLVGDNQWANYSGLSGQPTTYITVKNNIWVNCSISGQIARRINGGNNNGINRSYSYNTYYRDGEDTSASEATYDNGVILTSDPGFADPENGDFTISGSEQIEKGTGDPRWFPTIE